MRSATRERERSDALPGAMSTNATVAPRSSATRSSSSWPHGS